MRCMRGPMGFERRREGMRCGGVRAEEASGDSGGVREQGVERAQSSQHAGREPRAGARGEATGETREVARGRPSTGGEAVNKRGGHQRDGCMG